MSSKVHSKSAIGARWCFTVVAPCWLASTLLAPTPAALFAQDKPAYLKKEEAGPDYKTQGEYVGQLQTADGIVDLGLQIVALGDGKFRSVAHVGGLPGAGWDLETPRRTETRRENGKVIFRDDPWEAEITDDVAIVRNAGQVAGRLKRIERVSSTSGKQPPKDAIVLFDGSSADQWEGGRLSEEGWLVQGATSKQKFGGARLHLEFMLPFEPGHSLQDRGNSGVYVQGRYEVQMLDSFGLEGKQNECGGIYSVKDPDLNMCFPPLHWQTFDIDYVAPKFNEAGELIANPRMTVWHNGVIVHRDVELPGERSTTAAPVPPGPDPGPVYLQDHGHPVRYRNIWIVPQH